MLSSTKCAAVALAVAALCGCAHSTNIALSTDWTQTPAEDGGTVPTMAQVVDALQARAQRLVVENKRVGLIVEVEAAHAAVRAADYLRHGYADDLDTPIDRQSGQRQEVVKLLRAYVDDVANRGFDGPDSAERRLRTMLTGVQFEHFPRVLRTSHTYYAPNASEVIQFEVEGDFPESATANGDAYLSIDGHAIKNATRSPTTLTFAIPKLLVVRKNERVEYIPAQLKIPYSRGFSGLEVNTLDLDFIALPTNAGRVLYTTTRKVPKRETLEKTSTQFVQDTTGEDKETLHCEPMEPDWAIAPEKVELHLDSEYGKKGVDWFDLGNQSTPTSACWKIKSVRRVELKGRRGAKTTLNGKLAFTLHYTRFRDIPMDEPTVLDFDMAWGEAKSLTAAPVGGKIKYVRFDGQVFDFDRGESSSPYLKILHEGKGITFKAGP